MTDTTIPGGTTHNAAVTLVASDTLTINAGGVQTSTTTASVVVGTPATLDQSAPEIDNYGTLTNSNTVGNAIKLGSVNARLTLQNDGTISSAGSALLLTKDVSGNGDLEITNDTTISATGINKQARGIDFGANVSGAATIYIDNTAKGTIQAADGDAVRPGTGATIDNYGTMHGSNAGINTGASGINFLSASFGQITNYVGGSIIGGSNGVTHLVAVGATYSAIVLDNQGYILGSNGAGFYSENSGDVTNEVGATIRGAYTGTGAGQGDGVFIEQSATVDNYGLIEGIGAKGSTAGVANTSTAVVLGGGSLSNEFGATMHGATDGVIIGSTRTTAAVDSVFLSNDGVIRGDTGYGIHVLGNHDDVITNSGTILGGNGTAIETGAGNDQVILTGGEIDSLIHGGGGQDTLDLTSLTDSVMLDRDAGQFSGTAAVNAISGFQTILLGGGDDTMTASSDFGTVNMGDGNDSVALTGGAASDLLDGGSGTNTIDLTAVTVSLTVDTNLGTFGGLDWFASAVNFQSFLLGSGDDTLTASSVLDTVNLGAGDDRLVLLDGIGVATLMDGGDGNDTLDMSAVTEAVSLDTGAATLTGTVTTYGTVQNFETFIFGSGDDTLTNAASISSANLGDGNDLVVLADGSNVSGTLDGGAGTDTLDLTAIFGDFGLGLGTRPDLANGFADVVTGFEVVLLNDGNDTLASAASLVSVTLGSGNDLVILNGGGISGLLQGGSGNDTLDLSAASTALTVRMMAGTVAGTAWVSQFSNFREVIGGSGADDIAVGAGATVGYELVGGGGDDTLTGGAGNDTLDGGSGTNRLVVTSGDVVLVAATRAASTVTEVGDGTWRVVGGGGTDVLTGVAHVQFTDQTLMLVATGGGGTLTVAISSAGGLTNQAAQTISGTTRAGASVQLFDGTTPLGTLVTADGTGAWSELVTLSGQGLHSLTAKASLSGNAATSATVGYTLDTVAPSVAITSTGGLTNAAAQTVAGTGEAGTTVQLLDGGNPLGSAVTVDGTGHWSASVTLSGQGLHSLAARDTDAAGNAATSATVGYTLDTVAPATPTLALDPASDTGLAGDLRTADLSPGFSGVAEAGSTVTLLDGTTLVGTTVAADDGSFSIIAGNLVQGSHSLTATATDAAGNTSDPSATQALVIAPTSVPHDFKSDGTSEVLWLDDNGDQYQWSLNTDGSVAMATGNAAGPGWSILGSGDFFGDGHADILWRFTDGTLWMWHMNGSTIAAGSGPIGYVDSSWSVLGVGDFSGDGKADILWQHSGDNALWLFGMDGNMMQPATSGGIPYVGAPWVPVATGLLSGTGHESILFQNSITGDLYAWTLNGTTIAKQVDLGVESGATDWQVAGVADFNGDGQADILLRSAGTGDIRLWQMHADMTHTDLVVTNPGTDWAIVSLGDFLGDKHTDILWRNTVSGGVYLWSMDGNAIASQHDLGNPGSVWHVIA